MKWWGQIPWSLFFECWILSQLFHSSFTFIKRLFSFLLLSAIRVVSSAYLRLLIFLPAILIPAYGLSSPAFFMMYSAYKLNKQGDNIVLTYPFPIWNQSVIPCLVLTVTSWPAYRFCRRQIRWSGIPMSLTHFALVTVFCVFVCVSGFVCLSPRLHGGQFIIPTSKHSSAHSRFSISVYWAKE